MQYKCIKCGRLRKEAFLQQAVFRNFVGDEPVPGIFKCSSTRTCREARRNCKKCGHRVATHQHTPRWFDGKPGTYCQQNMGMGDPCGCSEYNK